MTDARQTANPDYVTVDIYDQTYHLTGQNPEQIRALASRVDTKMRAVAAQGRTVDSLRVAVLAALNLADELAQLGLRYAELEGARNGVHAVNQAQDQVRARAASLRGLLDQVLSEDRMTGS